METETLVANVKKLRADLSHAEDLLKQDQETRKRALAKAFEREQTESGITAVKKKTLTCGKCGAVGHTGRTCPKKG